MDDVRWKSVMNMGNAIIGISILAMPYCFAQCGIILGTLTLIFIAMLTSYSCKILIESSEVKNCKTYEFLAMNTFGPTGKFVTEICVIFMLFGSMVAYQQSLSDSAPTIVHKLFGVESNQILRYLVMIVLTGGIALPLSLSKKLDRLAGISALSFGVYAFFAIYMIVYAFTALQTESFYENIVFWKFSGLFKAIPIFSMSFSCQTVLFVVYDELPNASVKRMNKIIDSATIMVFTIYLIVGLFGYIAFSNIEHIHGNIITHMQESTPFEIILFGFVYAVLVGYPFMVVPCRNSLNTLLFSAISDRASFYLTVSIVVMTTITAILIPNIEFVLSLTGSTTGSVICYIVPALIHLHALSKANEFKKNAKRLSEFLLYTGLIILFVCSINTLYQSAHNNNEIVKTEMPDFDLNPIEPQNNAQLDNKPRVEELHERNEKLLSEINAEKKLLDEQLLLLKALREEIKVPNQDVKPNSINESAVTPLQDAQANSNAQKLIDNINLKNSELQNLIDEKLQNANQQIVNETNKLT